MTNKEITVVVIIGAIIVSVVSIVCFFVIQSRKIDAEINAQKDIQRIQIEEKEATIRTKERMQWIPWYKKQSN